MTNENDQKNIDSQAMRAKYMADVANGLVKFFKK